MIGCSKQETFDVVSVKQTREVSVRTSVNPFAAMNEAVEQRRRAEREFVEASIWLEAARLYRDVAVPDHAAGVSYTAASAAASTSLPPDWVIQRESGGDYNAYNPTGCYSDGRSGCYGKYQFGWFWGGKLGLPEDLSTATPEQQDAAARALWNQGAGCSNWSAC